MRAFHKGHLHEHCSDARIGQVRGAIHACLAKGRSGLGAMPSWWPFKSKKKQLDRDPRRMAQTIVFVPGAKGMASRGELVTMRGARRRRRRRR